MFAAVGAAHRKFSRFQATDGLVHKCHSICVLSSSQSELNTKRFLTLRSAVPVKASSVRGLFVSPESFRVSHLLRAGLTQGKEPHNYGAGSRKTNSAGRVIPHPPRRGARRGGICLQWAGVSAPVRRTNEAGILTRCWQRATAPNTAPVLRLQRRRSSITGPPPLTPIQKARLSIPPAEVTRSSELCFVRADSRGPLTRTRRPSPRRWGTFAA